MKQKLLSILVLWCVFYHAQADTNPLETSKETRKYCASKDLSPKQKQVLITSYMLGEKYGLGYSLSAIALQESLAGDYLVNVNDPSFGVHHILITTAARRAGVKGLQKNKLAQALMSDIKLSASFAVQELLFWKNTLKGSNKSWRNIWAAYNAGYNYKGKDGQEYATKIGSHIKWIKQCIIQK